MLPTVLICILLGLVACEGPTLDVRREASDSGSGPGGAGGELEGAGGTGGMEGCTEPMGQAAAQPCCPSHGLDACGAGLFCGAFDGRTLPTCYAEGARKDEESCTEDRQCASGSCNTDLELCRSQPETSCDPEIGCAPSKHGTRHTCHTFTGACLPVGDGSMAAVCEDDFDCGEDRPCRNSHCGGPRICGELTGHGACATDFLSLACTSCRTKSTACGSACGSTWTALQECAAANGCKLPPADVLDDACLDVRCDAELCEMERCATERCGKGSCY